MINKRKKAILSTFFSLAILISFLNVKAETPVSCWEEKDPILKPPNKTFKPVYDAESEVVLIFDDVTSTTYVYSFVENNWTSISTPSMAPSHSMAIKNVYDPTNDVVISFGGGDEDQLYTAETWAYDFNTNTWTNLTTSIAPPQRVLYGFVAHRSVG